MATVKDGDTLIGLTIALLPAALRRKWDHGVSLKADRTRPHGLNHCGPCWLRPLSTN